MSDNFILEKKAFASQFGKPKSKSKYLNVAIN